MSFAIRFNDDDAKVPNIKGANIRYSHDIAEILNGSIWIDDPGSRYNGFYCRVQVFAEAIKKYNKKAKK